MQKGFTLLEIAIVLTIIGLVIGGVIAGKDLLRSAELNTVISDVNKYQAAVYSFQMKYDALPGDIDNATAYWGAGVNNGNGDNVIATNNEETGVWEHLSMAGIITGDYTGIHAASGGDYQAGVNVPEAAMSGLIWVPGSKSLGDYATSPLIEELPNGNNYMALIKNYSDIYASELQMSDVLPAEDMAMLDKKADDGVAHTGNYLAANCNNEGVSFWTMTENGTANICNGTYDCNYDLMSANQCEFLVLLKDLN